MMRIVRHNIQLNLQEAEQFEQETAAKRRHAPYLIAIVIITLIVVVISTGIIISYQSLKTSRDRIRRNDLFTLRNAIELYKINHQKHSAPSDTDFNAFAGSLVPLFVENLPSDPGNVSYYYVRDTRNPSLYTLGGHDELRGGDAHFQYGAGTLEIDPLGVDGNPATAPERGLEFGFRLNRTID